MFLTPYLYLLAAVQGALAADFLENTGREVASLIWHFTRNYTLNPDKRPFTKANNKKGPCLPNVQNVWETPVWNWDWLTLAEIINVSVEPNYYQDAYWVNTTPEPATFKATESKAVAHASTFGWNVDATLKAESSPGLVPNLAKLGLDVKSGLSSSHTDTLTDTIIREVDGICPPNYECMIQTVTFSLKLSGTCYNETWFSIEDYTSDRALCKSGKNSMCDSVQRKWKNVCLNGQETNQPDVPCELSTPILRNNGELFSIQILRASPRTCQEVDYFDVEMKLSSDLWSGTEDTIKVSFGDSKMITLFQDPDAGSQVTKRVKVKDLFRKTISLDDLSHFTVFQEPAPHTISDDFKIESTC